MKKCNHSFLSSEDVGLDSGRGVDATSKHVQLMIVLTIGYDKAILRNSCIRRLKFRLHMTMNVKMIILILRRRKVMLLRYANPF